MTVEAVIFDWGGTLTQWAPVELEDMWTVAAEHLERETGRDARELQRGLHAAELRMWDRVNKTHHAGTLVELLADASQALGLDVAAAVMSEVATRHLDAWTPHMTHHPDALDTLQRLHASGLKLGLLSNTHWPETFHEHFLERDGLAAFLHVRAYTSNMRHSKPHRETFLHVLERLGVAPDKAVMVGDRPIDDVWGGQQVGMRGIWRPHDQSPPLGEVVPDAIIQHLSELPGVLRAWSEAAQRG
jgi:HAD superfamily hydrolase (TIGR01549 family)